MCRCVVARRRPWKYSVSGGVRVQSLGATSAHSGLYCWHWCTLSQTLCAYVLWEQESCCVQLLSAFESFEGPQWVDTLVSIAATHTPVPLAEEVVSEVLVSTLRLRFRGRFFFASQQQLPTHQIWQNISTETFSVFWRDFSIKIWRTFDLEDCWYIA